MKHKELQASVSKASSLFGVKMRYFTRDQDSRRGWRELDLDG